MSSSSSPSLLSLCVIIIIIIIIIVIVVCRRCRVVVSSQHPLKWQRGVTTVIGEGVMWRWLVRAMGDSGWVGFCQ